MGFFKKIVAKVKSWLSGGSSKPTSSRGSSGGGSYRNQSSGRVSYYGGGSGGSNGGRSYSRDDEEEKRRKKQEQKKAQERQEAFKAKKATYKDSGASVSLKKSVPDPKETARKESQARARATLKTVDNKLTTLANSTAKAEQKYRTESDKRIAARRKALDLATKKAYENDPKRNAARESMENRDAARERLIEEKTARKARRQEKHEAFHSATNHRYDVAEKGISKEERKKRAHNIQTATLGEMMGGRDDEAVDVMKAKMKYDKVGESARRGMMNTVSMGTLDLAEKRLNRGERKKAEEYYQENKSKAAETAGAIAGGLLLYGGTANTFEGLGSKAVSKAATTKVGKKLGAEALKKTIAGKGAKAALTRSLVGDAIQDSTIGLADTVAGVAARDDLKTPKDYAKAIAKGQAANYAMGLAGNAVAHGAPVARRAWNNFADESRKVRFVPKDTMDFMDDFVNDVGSGARRTLKMNGGTTRTNRLQGLQYEVGMNPRKLGKKVAATVGETEARTVREPSEILRGYSSKGSKKKIGEAQKRAESLIANGDATGARREISRAVDEIVRDARVAVPLDEATNEIKAYLKDAKISVSNKVDAGYESGSFNELRKQNFGSLKITEDGRPVDDLWGELQERYGTSLFPDDIDNPSDQLHYLARLAKSKGKEYKLEEDAAKYLKEELTNSLWESANKGAKSNASKAELPKTRGRKPSKSETRLKEMQSEVKQAGEDLKRARAEGNDEAFAEAANRLNDLYKEESRLEKNVKRAEAAREKRATDKAMERFESERAKKKDSKAGIEPPKAKPEELETGMVASSETVETSEQTAKGERTEFKRGEEPSAKERARNKRAERREKATQEGFDRDYAEFEKKINENRAKVEQLNGRLRAAATAEEQQAIKDEIKALDDEVKQMHRRASLKYHPDMGGSNEWAQQFNTAYDSYTKRVYSSPNFSGASSKSYTSGARNNTYRDYRRDYRGAEASAGNGGNTPPPPRGGRGEYADYDGLRRPKGYAKRKQRAMHSVEDMVGATKENKTMRETLRQFKDEANRKFVDSMKDFEQVARERLKTHGKESMQKLYGAIDKARRYRAIATTSVGSHQMKWDGTRYQIKGADGVMRDAPSIAEIFGGMDKETEKSFNSYLLLNHNIDRLREGKPVFDNTVIYNEELSRRLGLGKDIDLTDADVCKKLVQDYEARFPDFQDRAAQIRQYTANELNNRVKAGLLSQETMDDWLHKYPNYVPTYREGLFDGVSTAKGSTIGASDLKAAKGSDLNIYDIKEQLADATVRNWRDISLNNLLAQTFGDNIKSLASSAEVSPYMYALDHTMNVGKSADGGKYFANIYVDGKAERVEIEKRFYDDLKDLYKNGRMGNGLDGLNDKLLVPLASLWKNLITEWSPIFLVKNAMRDYPEAIINSRSRKEFLEITADRSALKDLLSGGQFSSSLRDAGISSSTFIDIDKAVKAWEKGEGGLANLLPRLNAGVEMYPRLVEYMATLKKAGYDLKTVKIEDIPMDIRDMAAANAADVTVNFGRSGSVGKLINKGAIPFFNPSIQGWSKFARNISELDGMKDTVGFLLATTALGTAPMVATNLLYHNNPNYQQISARDKANNYIIAIPPLSSDTDTFIKIPRSRFASVYGLPLVNVANENKMSYATAIQVINDQVAPINPLESFFGANLVQAARNKSWYGTPIESEAMQSLPANERYDATTSGISVGTAQALNKVSGGRIKVSPKKLDYVLDANFGVAADVALPLTTKSQNGNNPLARVANIGKRAFTIDSTTQNDLSSRYYDKSTALEQSKNSSEATDADQLAYTKFKSWDSRVKSVTSAMRYIQNSDMPNKQEAYRELAKLRNENMQKALDGRASINNTRDISIIHKYAGTSYTIENLGKSADQNALKAYGASVYGNLSEDEMRKKIDSDTEFYKGYEGIVKTQNALQKVNPSLKGGNGLAYAVGLANAGASDEVFAAYNTTVQSRTESASKAQRAKDYFKNSGSIEEFAQLENAVKSLGKLSDVDKDKLEDDAYSRLKRGEITTDEYNTELKKISYNANQSYVGKAVSLAQSGAPARAYNLYDIKEKNVQKGYNLAAMGIDSRAYREMSQACDKDGNGYLKTAEIKEYVANSDIEDKATLFDALCYYSNVRNPFGTPNRYSPEEAAEVGRRNGVAQIKANAGADNTAFIESSSSSSGYGGYGGYYRRRGYRRYGRGGGSSKSTAPAIKQSDFKAKKATYKDAAKDLPKASSSSRAKSANYNTSSIKSNTASAMRNTPKRSSNSTVKIAPPTVKFKKYEV